MALNLRNGGVYRCVFTADGVSDGGRAWKLVRIKDERGRNSVTLFYNNDDSGIEGHGECEFKIRVDSFGMENGSDKEGAKWGVKKAGDKWYPDLTFSGCKLYKVSENAPDKPFTAAPFEEVSADVGELPF